MDKRSRKSLQRKLFDKRISLIDEDGNIKEISEEEAKKILNEKGNKYKIVKRTTKGDSEEI